MTDKEIENLAPNLLSRLEKAKTTYTLKGLKDSRVEQLMNGIDQMKMEISSTVSAYKVKQNSVMQEYSKILGFKRQVDDILSAYQQLVASLANRRDTPNTNAMTSSYRKEEARDASSGASRLRGMGFKI